MIDLHAHILPGLDDGAPDLGEALSMAWLAVEDGIVSLVATPHVDGSRYRTGREAILSAVEQLNGQLNKYEIPLKILPGAEYLLEPDLPDSLARGDLLTLNDGGRYLLVELTAAFVPPYTERVLYELQLQGITPIIAHPERNVSFCRRPDLLRTLVSRGVPAQVTAGSLTGMFGREAARAAFYFLEHGLAHFVASDAHSSTGRTPVLSPALAEVERRLGADAARKLVDNSRRVLEGRAIPVEAAGKVRTGRRGLLQALLGKFVR
ncbi:tyrosine-protein phosphatase [Desulfofundulus thermosubterraneus]|uniref:protein-tyrosine-phosphatase n=1 Tax=Desulfofundulus thermosubterraneus DSM 16057 TaxID=1121432 RepID=A0A1M6IEX2_9FIRM|nr:CpsB/CapC family capsule biosynthesis tyrosine phosphatase [Desulfofundulus thermosubterraneus]SHJ32989.1 protein-tyrosine phosphatase [Desulfofundulus thermosubterraneus DSM 16057]